VNKKPIIIVSGEPYSTFLEIFFKIKKKNKFKNPIILIVSKKILLKQMKKLKFRFTIKTLDKKKIDFKKIDNKSINIINVDSNLTATFTKISKQSNIYINKCFNIALKLMKENNCAGLINGPISKKHFLKNKFLGITEFLAHKTNSKKYAMVIFNKNLSVSPITTHLPLKDVHKQISKNKIIDHINLIENFYKKYFNKKPRIGVTGLNPHCESNYKSSEENKIIRPSIKGLIKKKFIVKGPFPADTIFMKNKLKQFDVIVGMYHDQVLTPMKTLFEFNAINITLGLPFIRISPDHGPNTPMLGKNLSNPESLLRALNFLDK
jgi:4-hydroxythreonine-4-phosphate dehydrogenase